jgi:hypothetical protein
MAGRLPGSRAGKTLGLGVNQTWAHLFAQNEDRYESRCNGKRCKKPLTDQQITEFMTAEFPLTPEQRKWLRENDQKFKAFDYPTSKRSRYNMGKLPGQQEKPEKKSHRYDANGERIVGYRPRASGI